MSARFSCLLSMVALCLCAGCANITTPTGGRKDVIPPKRVSISPADSMLNTRVTRLEMHFDEYITVNEVQKEVEISPILPIVPTVTGHNKTVVAKIIDSLLEPNTTYRLSFGSSIRDLHEGNPYPKYTYTFSTGAYFDSLALKGNVINAMTGMADSGAISVLLYNGSENDSAVVRKKPRYITKTDASGNFQFKGLPKRNFKIYAVKDGNGNMVYDGPGAAEWVGFADNDVVPGDSTTPNIKLSVFAEIPDTATKKTIDSVAIKRSMRRSVQTVKTEALTYSVNLDTSNVEKRTFDITGNILVTFNGAPVLNKEKITLTYDSAGVAVSPAVMMIMDTITHQLKISCEWKGNQAYKLRLVKGFAKDTSGNEVPPSKYIFRTKEDDDYGKITLHLPTKYTGTPYVLRVNAEADSFYQQPVTDSIVVLSRLKAGKYSFRIIVDKNHNGIWDTGDLLLKRHAEEVIPYGEEVRLRQGFDQIIDFERKPKSKTSSDKNLPKSK